MEGGPTRMQKIREKSAARQIQNYLRRRKAARQGVIDRYRNIETPLTPSFFTEEMIDDL